MNATEQISWRELIVTDTDGDSWQTLGELVDSAPANLDNAIIVDGRIDSWCGFFISAPDEDPDWDTPRNPVDWSGFVSALAKARGES